VTSVKGVVVVAHGGREVSTATTTAVHPAVLRMIPVAAAIGRALYGRGVVVRRPRFRLRGWNGAQASPVHDLTEVLDEVRGEFGPVPVVMVGHSMGARAALRAAGYPSVTAVVGLASWLPAGEPVDQLAGRRILLAHGAEDGICRPEETWAYGDRARAVSSVAEIEVRGGEHTMLRRAPVWHAIAATFACVSLGFPPPPGPAASALASPGRTTLLRRPAMGLVAHRPRKTGAVAPMPHRPLAVVRGLWHTAPARWGS
jgi:pimeloyl-ACP methyl ester carboxylesterase